MEGSNSNVSDGMKGWKDTMINEMMEQGELGSYGTSGESKSGLHQVQTAAAE